MPIGDIQDGIIWQSGTSPRSHFKLLIIDFTGDVGLAAAKRHLEALWTIWDNLRKGRGTDLIPGHEFDPAGLQVMIGYGHRFFDGFGGRVTLRPHGMVDRWRFLAPSDTADRVVLPGASLRYAAHVARNSADAPIAVQFTANSPLAVARAHKETARYLATHIAPAATAGLRIAQVFDGFAREDRRSWITFHDGVSNLPKGELRRQVIAVKPDNAAEQEWSLNGTYCVFMKIAVDLDKWSRIGHSRQELLVGREKFTGSPMIDIAPNGMPIADARCPVAGTREVVDPGNERFREPPDGVPAELRLSHVQRANHHREPFFRVDSRRIYRQGFEYLEGNDGRLETGLNFVSFQDDPDRTFFILTQPGWLGDVNFGGDPSTNSTEEASLLSVISAGSFFVPPVFRDHPFPGSLFFEQLVA